MQNWGKDVCVCDDAFFVWQFVTLTVSKKNSWSFLIYRKVICKSKQPFFIRYISCFTKLKIDLWFIFVSQICQFFFNFHGKMSNFAHVECNVSKLLAQKLKHLYFEKITWLAWLVIFQNKTIESFPNTGIIYGMVQNTQIAQIAQITQMTQETQIRSKCLKHADDVAADADFPSACFRCLKHADDRGAAQMLIFHMHHSPVVAFNLFSATLYPFWSPGSWWLSVLVF